MTILALRCIVKDHRHRNLQHSLRRPSIGLARQQQPDGGFGNLYNTALVLQVLVAGLCLNNVLVAILVPIGLTRRDRYTHALE